MQGASKLDRRLGAEGRRHCLLLDWRGPAGM
jgi:hypothetical protein